MSANQSDANSASTSTFLSSLILNAAVAGAELLAFIILKNKFRKVYSPRSYLPPKHARSEALPRSFWSWIPFVIKADSDQIIRKNGLDAFYFLRFLRLMLWIFVPFFVLSWAILLPIYGAGTVGTATGLDKYTFGNVAITQQSRYAAPLILIWILTFWIFYLIRKELIEFIVRRQDFLISAEHAALPQSKTVLLTGVPPDMLSLTNLKKFTSYLPGGARRIWFVRDLKELPDLYDRRVEAFSKLESGETALAQLATKAQAKEAKSGKSGDAAAAAGKAEEGKASWEKYVPEDQRPTHKLGFFGLIGKKVETIPWAKEEIAATTKELDEARANLDSYEPFNSVFIEFNTQIAAHMFAQSLAHHMPLRMTGRWIEVSPEDVIWSTLNIPPLQQRGRYVISWAITVGIIIFWAIPVAFVGAVSNLTSLCATVSWMRWLCNLPTTVTGIIQGVLPPVLLAVLFMLLPIVLRMLAIFEGIPLNSLVEVSLMSRYFMFLVIHGFLIVTLSSGLIAAIPVITQNPSSAVSLLAQNLPKASTFFLTYIVTTTLSGAAGSLLQIAPLATYYVKMFLLASTPRSIFDIRYTMGQVAWGTLFPNITLLTVIGLSYAVVSPIVNGFIMLGFALYWFVYKYLFTFVYDMPPAGETGGLFFPKAIGHMFVGMYIQQVFLCALFFFAQDSSGNQSALPEGALMVVLIIATALFHLLLKTNFYPVIDYLPVSLASKIEENQGMGPPTDNGAAGSPSASHFTDKEEGSADMVAEGPNDGKLSGKAAVGPSGSARDGAVTQDLNKHAFDHPATYENLKPVWLARDRLGVTEQAIRDLRECGIEATDEGAEMDDRAKVTVTRNPPGSDEDIELPPTDRP